MSSRFQKGYTPWNKGKRGIFKHSNDSKIKMSQNKKGKYTGRSSWNKGLKGVQISDKKGKKFEDYYGIDKANEIKNKMKNKIKDKNARLNNSHGHKEYYRLHPISMETRKKMSLSQINKIHKKGWKLNKTKEWIDNNTQAIKRFYQTERGLKVKEIIGLKTKLRRMSQIFPSKDTSIELKIQDFLKQLNIEFYPHQYIKEIEHSYQCDIFIPSLNLIIECDGDYWHKYPFGNEIDHIRDNELKDKDFKILRFWERDIRKMDLIGFKDKLEGGDTQNE